MNHCSICSKTAIFKIKGENIYYCKEHAEEFFDIDSLEIISKKIESSVKEAEILEKFIKFKKNF